MTSQVPVAEGLFTWPSDSPQLIGSKRDGVVTFPAEPGAPEHLLGTRGTLWSFTTQEFRPPSPPYDGNDTAETFVPYALGYVELPGELLLQTRFAGTGASDLEIGQEMELCIVPYTVRDDGTEVLTYAFTPVTSKEGGPND